jgi:hypothetical protein
MCDVIKNFLLWHGNRLQQAGMYNIQKRTKKEVWNGKESRFEKCELPSYTRQFKIVCWHLRLDLAQNIAHIRKQLKN